MPDRDNNVDIEFTTGGNTGTIATDYPRSGVTNAHTQIVKVCWGEPSEANRVTTAAPLPVNIISGATLDIVGTVGGTGSFTVINSSTSPFRIAGATGAIPVPVTGNVQGVTGGIAFGITGTVTVGNTYIGLQGISGGYPVAITGGRGLSAATDSVTVSGTVGITGGRYLLPAFDGVKIYSSTAGTTIPVQLWGGTTAIGISGNALNVNIVGAGITATVSVSALVGICQANQATPLFIAGATAGPQVRIKGGLTGGAVEVGWSSALPVSISGSIGGISFSDTNIVNSLSTINSTVTTTSTTVSNILTQAQNISNKLPSSGTFKTTSTLVVPTSVITGEVSLATTGDTTLSGRTLASGVTVKALLNNAGDVRIRGTGSSSNYYLGKGESIFIAVDDISKLIFSSNGVAVNFCYIAS
jgi:hypothetical protein